MERPRILADTGPGYADYGHYHQSLSTGPNGELHLAYNIYRFDNPSPLDRATGAGHMMSVDGGATWKTIDGLTLTQPVHPNSNVFFRTTTAPFGLSTNNIAVDSNNNPWITVWDYNNQTTATSYLYRRTGTQWQSYRLDDLLPSSAAGLHFNTDFTVSLDATDGVYIAGNLSGNVAVLYSPNIDTTPFELLIVDPARSGFTAQGITLERPVGHNSYTTPRLAYYDGTDGNRSTVYSVRLTGPLDPQTRTWAITGSGSWTSPNNWSPNSVPDGANFTASFIGINSAASTVMLDTNVVVNQLSFSSSKTYVLAGTGQITFAGDEPGILVSSGSHQLQARVALGEDTSIDVTSGSFEFNNQIDLAGHTLTTLGNVSIHNSVVDSIGSGGMVNAGTLSAQGMSTIAGDFISIGTLSVDVLSSGSGAGDLFNVLGAAELRGFVSVDVADGFSPRGDITILTATEGISLSGSFTLDGPDAKHFSGVRIIGNSLVLSAAAVPEPTTAASALLCSVLFSFSLARPSRSMRPLTGHVPVFVTDSRTIALSDD